MSGLGQLTADVADLRKQAQQREQLVALVERTKQGADRLEGRLVHLADAVFEARAGVRIGWDA